MNKYFAPLFIGILSLACFPSFVGAQEYVFSKDLSVGMNGDDVVALQTWLISNGYDIPAISSNGANKGYFGSQTKQALMKYQVSIGLPDTGYFGPLTRGRMHGSYRGNSLVVTSPNGGEIWKVGTVQNITWNSAIKQGLAEKSNYTVDIKLAFPLPACAKPGANPVCAVAMRAPYTIASGVGLSTGTYAWKVGSYAYSKDSLPNMGISAPIPDGQYLIQVCPTNGSQCDESNGEFTITSSQLLQVCPSEKIINRMPSVYPNQNASSTYYLLHGARRELSEFDSNWVASRCVVAEQVVY